MMEEMRAPAKFKFYNVNFLMLLVMSLTLSITLGTRSFCGAGPGDKPVQRSPAGMTESNLVNSDRALEINGQTRRLLMTGVGNGKESIDFGKPRTSYHKEIKETQR